MQLINSSELGVVGGLQLSSGPRFKIGNTSITIPLKTENEISVYSTNVSGSPPVMDVRVTAERLN